MSWAIQRPETNRDRAKTRDRRSTRSQRTGDVSRQRAVTSSARFERDIATERPRHCPVRLCLWAAMFLVLFVGSGCGCSQSEAVPELTGDSHARMVAELRDIRDRTPDEHPYIGDAQLRQAESVLTSIPDNSPPQHRFQAIWALAYHQARLGRLAESISNFEDAYSLLPQMRPPMSAEQREMFLLHMSMACLRLGETQNCLHCENGESCILPLKGGGVHTQRSGTRKAITYLNVMLEENPKHLTARYLLNIAVMAVGEYPAGVPEQFRVSADKFQSTTEFPRFRNVARQLGIDPANLCGGVILDDFDNDGFLDILASTWDTSGELILFRNQGNGGFERQTKQAGLEGIFGGLNLVQADYDNDGDVDVLVLRGAWLGEVGHHPNSLLQNDGKGHFRDVTFDAGLGELHYPTQTAAWADYDNDGDLDLYIGNEGWPNQLFKNNGQGEFIDVALLAGVHDDRFTKGVVWGDYDNDNYPDLFVSNYGQENALFHNNRNGTFTNVAPATGLTRPIQSFPTWFWDYNNDGKLDLFVSSWWADVKHVAAEFFDEPYAGEYACLYEGDGTGRFRNVAAERDLQHVAQPMGANLGDIDNDGWLDMYLSTGYPEFEALMPNVMFRNHDGERFDDVTMAGGFGHLQKGHAVAFGDLDNDGDQDIYVQMGGAFPGDRANNLFFENPGNDRCWIGIKLIGRESNRSAIGTRIRIDVVAEGNERSIYRWVNSGGSFGANPLQQQVGLGHSATIERVEIYWPRTGKTQTFRQVPVNQFLEITEGADEYRRRALKRIRFPTSGADSEPKLTSAEIDPDSQ